MSSNLRSFAFSLAVLCACAPAHAQDRRIVVAADGSGDFRTVQEAIDAVPDNSLDRTVILIKPGVYSGATAVFEHCEVKSKNGGYVTAASTPPDRPYGFVFLNSRLSSDPRPWVDPAGTPARATPLAFLGRPWRPYGSVTFVDTDMGTHIRPEGWDNWRNPENEKTARYAEYNSSGPGASPGTRVAWSKQLSAAQARAL